MGVLMLYFVNLFCISYLRDLTELWWLLCVGHAASVPWSSEGEEDEYRVFQGPYKVQTGRERSGLMLFWWVKSPRIPGPSIC